MNKFFKDNLEIFLVTYNRDFLFKKTMETLLESPFKDCNITILDNDSDDLTYIYGKEFTTRFKNLKYVKHKKNIGGNANITRALELCGGKKYCWILCDDDNYNFDNIEELKGAIEQNIDMIFVANYFLPQKYSYGQLFRQSAFAPSMVFKTDLITSDVLQNAHDNVVNFLPHFALSTKVFNENKSIERLEHGIVIYGGGDGSDPSLYYLRGRNEIHPYRKYLYWGIAYYNSVQFIHNYKIRQEIIDEQLTDIGNGSIFNGIYYVLNYNRYYKNNFEKNIFDVFYAFDFKKRIMLLLIYLWQSFFKGFIVINSIEGFKDYCKKKNAENRLIKFLNRYKNVIIYGGGLYSKGFMEYLNEIAFTDKWVNFPDNIIFADSQFDGKSDFYGYKAINSLDISKYPCDIILCLVYEDNKIRDFLKRNNMNQKLVPLIKRSWFEKMFGCKV